MHSSKKTIYSLELLRFLLAAMVFFGHYVHFYMHFEISENKGFFYKINPTFGAIVVPMFFLMSGSIFAYTYLNNIQNRRITFLRYAQNRLARLYPLHLITLLSVAAFQGVYWGIEGQYFIYQYNDAKHFILNLLFIENWGFEDGASFNGPSWSVSHEIFLYIIFYIIGTLSGLVKSKVSFFGVVVIIIGLIEVLIKNPITLSAFAFFVGVYLSLALNYCLQAKNTSKVFVRIAALIFMVCILGPYFSGHGLPYGAVAPLILVGCLLFDHCIDLKPNSTFCKLAAFVGNISYSTYLLHFPVQLIMLIVSVNYLNINFASPGALFCYVLLVLGVSVLSFEFFEKPAKEYLLQI